MRFSPERYDAVLRRLVEGSSVEGPAGKPNPNMMIPWFLMASYRYYAKDDPFLTDGCYDWLCAELDRRWDEVEHRHKPLIDRAGLKAGTAFDTDWDSLPSIIKSAADHLADKYGSLDEIKPRCRHCDGSGWFYNTEDLGPCGCPEGEKRATSSIDDLIGPTAGIEDLL